ncbi:MAG TPA: hypothetical protein VHO06_25905 [Polyangia bacterium]|nr:hypothetical protein [Polyangia bacterium]
MPTMEHAEGGNLTRRDVVRAERMVAGSSFTELIAGGAAIVLPILGLVGVLPISLAAVAFIAIGAAMMIHGGTVGTEAHTLLSDAAVGESTEVDLGGGVNAQILGGAAVIALGILALLRIAPFSLLPVSAIVAGGAMVLGAGTASRLASVRYGTSALSPGQREVLRESVRASAGADVLVGLASIVLGILVLAGIGSLATMVTLVLVAALALGGGLFLTGTTTGARMTALLRH